MEKGPSTSPTRSRTRKGSKENICTLTEFSALLRESEERLKSFLKSEIDSLGVRIERIESKLSLVQTQCANLDNEISMIKSFVVDEQIQIENHEKKLRASNIIVHNIPEDEVTVGAETFTSDSEKILTMCHMAKIDLEPDEVVHFQRLGKRQTNKTRPLKVQLKSPEQKFKLLLTYLLGLVPRGR